MKVIFEIPDKVLSLAEALLIQQSKDHEEPRIKAAAAKCKEEPTEIPAKQLEDNEEATQMFLAFALMGLALRIDELPNEEQPKSGLAARLEEMQKQAEAMRKG